MKKIIIVYAVLIIAVILLAIIKAGGKLSLPNLFGQPTAQIGNARVNLLLAKTPGEQVKGLSGRNGLPANQGMLFVFKDKGNYAFWMKGMKFPLDLIYVSDNSVVDIIENAPVPATPANFVIYRPSAPANYVLEVNAGFSKKNKIQKGTKATFRGI